MRRIYAVAYGKLSKTIVGTKLELFSEIVLLLASGYLLLKKAFGLSISGWLSNHALQPGAIKVYYAVTGMTLAGAMIVTILSVVFKKFPAVKHALIEPEHIAECLVVMNHEIAQHIRRCDSDELPSLKKLKDQHAFDRNITLVVDALTEHVHQSSNRIKIRKRDLFVSLYTFDQESNVLLYELHYHPNRDLVNSRVIPLSDPRFEGYECVKCMKSADGTAYVLNRNDYVCGSAKRYKTMQQYMGCKLEHLGTVFGFLNIELHNQQIFDAEDEMQEFMEEKVFPFKLLLEYQYLKRAFFGRFEDLDEYWEVG
ncbi:MAG: hypothetical protein H6953_08860 [Chromatiaceae bacterium]|nr:hypothetical protein [Chromatiaceae bacterium]MCP5315505.1 hypothetical protein [Chromatiaceae bacterium]